MTPFALSVLKRFAFYDKPVSLAEVYPTFPRPLQTVKLLVEAGMLNQQGKDKAFKYQVTKQGRKARVDEVVGIVN